MCHAGAIKTDDSCVVLKVSVHVPPPAAVRRPLLTGAVVLSPQTLPCLVRMCSKEHLLEVRVEGAETLAYLIEPDVELQRIASTTDHLVAMLADYFKYPSSVSAITDIKRVSERLQASFTEVESVLQRSGDRAVLGWSCEHLQLEIEQGPDLSRIRRISCSQPWERREPVESWEQTDTAR